MGDSLKDRVAIVTGAGRGIGRAIAMLMAEEGAKVVVNDIGTAIDGTGTSNTPGEEVVQEIKAKGGMAVANSNSVATWDGAESIIKTAVDNFGRVDILVNNAGITRDRIVFNMSEEEWDAVIAVHLKGTFNTIRHASPLMRQQQFGRIINMSSQAGLGNRGQANYSSAKEGMVGLTRTVALDLGKYNITCNAIRPRAATRMTDTPEMNEAMEKAGMMAVFEEEVLKNKPEDVAPFIAFLATEQGGIINGRNFEVYGGRVALYSEPEQVKTIFKDGRWSVGELIKLVPGTLAAGLVNPAPPQKK